MSNYAYVVSASPKSAIFCDSQSRLLNAQISTLLNPPTAPILSFTGSTMLFLKLAFVLSVCLLNFIKKAQIEKYFKRKNMKKFLIFRI